MGLTKSKYLSGLQCIKRLWIEEHAPQHLGKASPVRAQLRAQGIEVGKMARARFPDGRLIHQRGRAAVQETKEALQAGATCLFEAAFVYEDVYVRCDILQRETDGSWTLIEVKSTTRVKQHHLHDLAIQQWVLRQVGMNVRRVVLMHLNNRSCVYPDLDNLFIQVDITKAVRRKMRGVARQIARLRRGLAQRQMPDVQIGPHCNLPYPCPAKGLCWQDAPRHSIFTIPRIAPDKLKRLLKRGILHVRDIPAGFPLSPVQWAYVRRVVDGRTEIDIAGIAQRLQQLVYPLYFLDFETHSFAVPRFDGMRPYQQLPFQYSCHILAADGTLTHREYLHTDAGDPRMSLAEQLCRDIGADGSIVVYNASFERTVLQELARGLPAYRDPLRGMATRLWDQLDVFRYDYLDPAFEGSNSIKYVLPVLAPELTYDDLAVQRGDHAQAAWRELVESTDPAQRETLAAQLRAYCRRDTMAMVAIHRVLQGLLDEGEDA